MIILITGANGTIGCDLVQTLCERYKILALCRTENLFSKNFRHRNVTWIKCDLKDGFEHKATPDLIIHGAVTHPFASKNSNKDYINSNIISLSNIIDFANKKGVRKFIYLSSVVIYGKVCSSLLTDNNNFNSPNLLGATKILSETLLKNHKFNFLSLRLPGVLCRNSPSKERPWLNSIIYKIKESEDIKVYNKDAYFNNLIDTDEIINFIEYTLINNFNFSSSFNFSASKPIKIQDMLYLIKDFFHSN